MKGAGLAEQLPNAIVVRNEVLQAFIEPQALIIQPVQTQNATQDDNRPQRHPVGLHVASPHFITEKVQVVPNVPIVQLGDGKPKTGDRAFRVPWSSVIRYSDISPRRRVLRRAQDVVSLPNHGGRGVKNS